MASQNTDLESLYDNILKDAKIDLDDEFDRNFERKAFFDQKWPETKWPVNIGSLMMRTGKGRKSITSKIEGDSIVWRSSLEYMALHNEGGEIEVTQKMKKFFWAMYYKANGAIKGTPQRQQRMTQEAQIWKNLALKKVGDKMKIPRRQFIGDHPQVEKSIQRAFDENMITADTVIANLLKQK